MRRTVFAWTSSLAALAAAIALRWAMVPLLGYQLPFVTLFGAVAAAVWLGGWRPALATVLLGYAAARYLFIDPNSKLALDDVAQWSGLVAYLFTCALIIAFGEALRRARRQSGEQHELLQVTLASIGDAVITTDIDGRVTNMNPVAESLTGWSLAAALGQPLDVVFRIVNEATRAPVESPAARALREGVVVGLANHTVLIHRDGREFAIDDSAAPIRDAAGVVSGCVLIFRDFSAQRGVEVERARQLHAAQLYASIVESSDDAIVSKTLDGVIRSWNAAAERLFGHTAEQAVGRHISLIIPPERRAEEDRIVESLKRGDRIEHFETERLARDGRRVHVSLTISPIKDAEGNVIGASKIARDITERKRIDADLQRLAADLARADRRKDEFLAMLAHELRNPLAPMTNMLEVMRRAEGDQAIQRVARETIARQLGQLIRLVDDLLDLSRITHDRLELRHAQVDLASVLQQAIEACRPHLEAAEHQLHVSLPAEPVTLVADTARLAQIFGNLLNNAGKYTPRGGRIDLVARREGAEVVVIVRDTGSGIPADKLEAIFEMFEQVDRSLERSQGGLGIGLSLVRRLAEMHGGSVRAYSDGPGRGSEFVVRLPLPDGAAARPSAGPPAGPTAVAGTRRVLIVDDNVDAAASLAMLLQMTGHATQTSHDGEGALEAIERDRPDIVLLDIGLPRVNGFEVCRRARAQPWGASIVFIALSGWGKDDDLRRSEEAGFDGHLVKPVDHATLVTLLASLAAQAPAGSAAGGARAAT